MKRVLFTLFVTLLTTSIFAQNYTYTQSTGTSAPYAFNYPNGTNVLSIPSTDVLSSWQTLPFAWNFYGQAVTGYYVSDNGYITFDQNATTSDPNNTTIPNAGGPNNAIYAFWDDLGIVSGGGATDQVFSYTYGTAPNRVHVVQYFSVTPASGSGFCYPTVRIYECGDFDIVIGYANAASTSGTVGAENSDGSMGVQLPGAPNMVFTGTGSAANDDIVYTFRWDQVQYDLEMVSLDYEGTITIGNQNLTGTIVNNGAVPVTSFDLHYSLNGGAAQTMNVTGVNIATGANYNFSHNVPWNITAGGQNYTVCIWADNINGNTDERTCNDQICKDLFTNAGISGTRKVLIEEFTGAWCGWCPDGEVVVDGILASNPNDVISVSVHDGDGMEFSDGIRSGFGVSAYPNAMVDRKVFPGEPDEPHSRGAWAANATAQIGSYTPADITTTYTYNSTTRVIDITCSVNFVDYAAGDIRIVPMVVEDDVTGSGSQYNQVNYLNGSAGHPFFGAGDPIVGYVHKRVLRALPGGAYGNAGVIPSQVTLGDTYTESFQYTLPAGYNEEKISVIGAIAYYSTTVGQREMINSSVGTFPINTKKVADVLGEMSVFPNPANQQFSVSFDAAESVNAEVVLFDMFGRRVAVLENNTYAKGNHILTHNVSNLASGTYYVSILTDKNQTYSRRLVIVK